MSVMKIHVNRIDTDTLGWAKDGAFNVVDMSSLVSASAVGVILEAVNGSAVTQRAVGSKSILDAGGTQSQLAIDTYTEFIVGFEAGTQTLHLRAQDSTGKIYIRGEMYEPDVSFRSRRTLANINKFFVDGQAGQWIDYTVTRMGGDAFADIEAVILSHQTLNSSTNWGMRRKGSTDGVVVPSARVGYSGTYIVGTDSNGQYQLFRGAKNADPDQNHHNYREHGYIKKGKFVAITNPSDEDVVPTGPFATGTLDLSNTIPIGARYGILRWQNANATILGGYTIPIGSTDLFVDRSLNQRARILNILLLSDARTVTYNAGSTNMNGFVTGYVEREATKKIVDGGKTIVDGGKVIID